jgi:sulfonate transport system permease protein
MTATDRVFGASAGRMGAGRRRRHMQWRGLVVPALLLVAWQGLCTSGLFTPDVMPSRVAVLADLSRLWTKGQLLGDIAVTTWRVALGFLLGTALATVLGAVVGYSRSRGAFSKRSLTAFGARASGRHPSSRR